MQHRHGGCRLPLPGAWRPLLLGAALLAALATPPWAACQTPSPGWSFYGAAIVSPWGFIEAPGRTTFGVAAAALHRTGTSLELGTEALYEHLFKYGGVTADKLQVLGLARLRALRGAVQPYAEASLGLYHMSSRFEAVIEAEPIDDRTTANGLLLGLGGGLEAPVSGRLAVLLGGRLHGHIGERAGGALRAITPTLGVGVRVQ
jgi:hypothetical protein